MSGVRIGVISDTHSYFDPAIPRLFAGVSHILHAGDVGGASITSRLQQIAPLTAVLGNTDTFIPLKETELVELAGRKFLLHHIVEPHALTDALKTRISRARPDVVVFGHTHKPCNEVIGGVLYFNPGYAGQKRFNLPRSMAILHCDEREIRAEFLPL